MIKSNINWANIEYITSTPSQILVEAKTYDKKVAKEKVDPSKNISREFTNLDVTIRMDNTIQKYSDKPTIVSNTGKEIKRWKK